MKRVIKKALRIAFLFVFFFGIFGFVLPAIAFQNEPDGFRGIKWGNPIHIVAGKIEKREDKGQLSMVTFKDEKLNLGGADLLSINYVFKDGKLFSVLARGEKLDNFNALKKYFVTKHGLVNQSDKPDKKTEAYQWNGEVASIRLIYRPQNEQFFLQIASTRAAKSLAEEINRGKREDW